MEIITLIQGDDLGLDFEINGEEEILREIKDVIFSCKDENIVKKCTKIEENLYFLDIFAEETKNFVPKIASFDITIQFLDGRVVTKIYQNKLQVLEKRNKID